MTPETNTTLRNPGVVGRISVVIVSTLILDSGFLLNGWNAVEHERFLAFQRDTESLVLGRMVMSRDNGIFSAAGMTGAGINRDIHQEWILSIEAEHQYDAYIKGTTFDTFAPYMSQIGGQAMFFSLLSCLLPFSPRTKLDSLHLLTSVLSAMALAMIILWFHREFGLGVAVCVLLSMVVSQWLTLFGRNLWWCLWAFYLPMLGVIRFTGNPQAVTQHGDAALAAVVFILTLTKCLFNGFEYITATVLMTATPAVYYAVLHMATPAQSCKRLAAIAGGSLVAVLVAVMILTIQISSVRGGISKGVDHVYESLLKRTHGAATGFPAVYAAGLESETVDVVITYLGGTFLDPANKVTSVHSFVPDSLFAINYGGLIAIFAAASVYLLCRPSGDVLSRRRQFALVSATWFSLSAPMSWFVLFKAHSSVHTHMNFIVWQMPFVFLGFAVCGTVAQMTWADLLRLANRNR